MNTTDMQGKKLSKSDRIMYIVGNQHDICYGVIWDIYEKQRPYGRPDTVIKVWKTHGPWHEKDKYVYLTFPIVFKCDSVLNYPTDTKVEGM